MREIRGTIITWKFQTAGDALGEVLDLKGRLLQGALDAGAELVEGAAEVIPDMLETKAEVVEEGCVSQKNYFHYPSRRITIRSWARLPGASPSLGSVLSRALRTCSGEP